DIKPANLLVTTQPREVESLSPECRRALMALRLPPGVIKILDMGLARFEEAFDMAATVLTQLGTVVGTPDFISPEQARNSSSIDIRAALYSLGCTGYFLLTGRPPFPSGTLTEKLLQHQLDHPEPVQALRPEVPTPLAAILSRLMAKEPDQRYQTPAEAA